MDEVNQITSMGRTTAYPISIIAQMILEKNITKYGVLFGEVDVPFDIFLSEMKKRNMDFDIIISD
jgi:lysine 6-dehydrogenase